MVVTLIRPCKKPAQHVRNSVLFILRISRVFQTNIYEAPRLRPWAKETFLHFPCLLRSALCASSLLPAMPRSAFRASFATCSRSRGSVRNFFGPRLNVYFKVKIIKPRINSKKPPCTTASNCMLEI